MSLLSDEEADGKGVSKLRLTLVQGDNYACPNGDYTRTSKKVRDKNIWISESNSRMMFYAGDIWVVTSTGYMQEILDGATGGFISSGCADNPYTADWGPNYKITEVYLSSDRCWVDLSQVGTMVEKYRSPSVHIWWSAPNGYLLRDGIKWFYNEITVTLSAPSTYFMTNGFTGGYMGIQDRSPKWVLFSIWDKVSQEEERNVMQDDLVSVVDSGKDVTVRPFGGEGTGFQSFLEYDWKVGEKYQLMVNVKEDSVMKDKVIFTGWFRIPELNVWRMLSSLKVRPMASSKTLEHIYSFIEDWSGNGHRREGLWGNAWVKTENGPWVQATKGHGTTTEMEANNRRVFKHLDSRCLGMSTGGPPLEDRCLGPYECIESTIPSVLTVNPLPTFDGAPANE